MLKLKENKRAERGNWKVLHPFVRVALIGGAVLGVALGAGFWQRQALKEFGNEWSAERHLTKARQELKAGNASVAMRRALTSIQLEPDRIDTLRILITAARESSDTRALLIAQTLFGHSEATVEDQIVSLAAINDVGDSLRFEHFWNQFSEDSQLLPEARAEYLRYLLAKGEPKGAIKAVEGVNVLSSPALGTYKLEAFLRIDTPETDKEAFELALSLIESAKDQDLTIKVLNRLGSLTPSRFDSAFLPRLESALASLPLPTLIDPTIPYTIQLVQAPSRKSQVIDEAVLALKADDIDPLCLWLTRVAEPEVILEHIGEVQAYRSNIAYEARVRALMSLERFDDAFTLLQYPPDIADKIGVLMLRASVARVLGRKSAETTAWRAALLEAERDLTQNHYLKLSRFALAVGENSVAADAIVAACRHPRGVMPPSSEIEWVMPYLIENDRPDDLLSVSQRFLVSEWSNPVLMNNSIYLSLLLNGDAPIGENVLTLIEDLASKNPGILGIRTTLALAYLQSGRGEDAHSVFRPEEFTGIGWQRFAPSDRAIFAMALRAHGSGEHATNVIAMIDWSEMLEAERAFFRSSLIPSEVRVEVAATGEEGTDQEPKKPDARLEKMLQQSERTENPEAVAQRLELLKKRNAAEKAYAESDAASDRGKLLEERRAAEQMAAESEALSPRAKMLRERQEKTAPPPALPLEE